MVCRIIEPVSPGYSCRLKQKNKIAGRRCRIQSEMLPSETTPRAPSSPCPRLPLETWLASLKDRSANRFPGARKLERSEGSVPAPRVKQRKKDVDALSFPNPQNMQAGRKRNQQSEDREVICVVFWKVSQCVPPRDAFTREKPKGIQYPCSLAKIKKQ